MNRKEFIDDIVLKSKLPATTVKTCVDQMWVTIADALAKGETVNLTGYCSFKPVTRKGKHRHPITGKVCQAKFKHSFKVKMGETLKRNVNDKTEEFLKKKK